MRGRVQVQRILGIALLLLISPPGPTYALNFGSNTASGGTGAHACDDTSASQCVANNGTHTIDDIGLSAAWNTAVDDAIDQYDDDPSVSVAWSASSALDDVWAYSADQGINNMWAWTACHNGPSVTFGGTDPNRWCRPQVIRFNDSYTQTASQKKSIACHEMGHTLGLRHSNEAGGSCMIKNQRTILEYSAHDSIKLDQQY